MRQGIQLLLGRKMMCLLVFCLLCGCGTGDPQGRHSAAGQVTLDGTPLKSGAILFFPIVTGDPTEAKIQEGRFQLSRKQGLRPGEYRVEIRALEKTGKKIPGTGPGGMTEEIRELIPGKYNR